MKKAFIIILLTVILITPLASQSAADMIMFNKILAFEKPWDVYVRKLYGCPPIVDVNTENCRPSMGGIDYKAFKKACEAAKDLFQLTGDCS